MSDLGAVVASTVGKIELESVGDDAPEERIVERLITKALFTTFGRIVDLDDLDEVVLAFEDGLVIETGDRVPSREYVRWMAEIPGLHVAGNAYQGIGIPDCIRMGKAAAGKILSESSHR